MRNMTAELNQNGIHYTLHGDYYLPDLELPEKASAPTGRYGRMRKAYLEEYRPDCMNGCSCPGNCTSTWQKLIPAALNGWIGWSAGWLMQKVSLKT